MSIFNITELLNLHLLFLSSWVQQKQAVNIKLTTFQVDMANVITLLIWCCVSVYLLDYPVALFWILDTPQANICQPRH